MQRMMEWWPNAACLCGFLRRPARHCVTHTRSPELPVGRCVTLTATLMLMLLPMWEDYTAPKILFWEESHVLVKLCPLAFLVSQWQEAHVYEKLTKVNGVFVGLEQRETDRPARAPSEGRPWIAFGSTEERAALLVLCLGLEFHFIIFLNLLILEREGRREGETSVRCSPYLSIHSLILVCALTRDRTCNLGIPGWCSNWTTLAGLFCFVLFL